MTVEDSEVFDFIRKKITDNTKTTWGKNELLYSLLNWEVEFVRSHITSSDDCTEKLRNNDRR